MTTWIKVTDLTGPWVHWLAERDATEWIAAANAYADAPLPADLAGRRAQLVALWTALSWAYQAMDLPPCSDPVYRAAWDARDAPPPVNPRTGYPTTDFFQGTWHQEGSAAWTAQARAWGETHPLSLVTIVRPLWLRCDGMLDATGMDYAEAHPAGLGTTGGVRDPWSKWEWWTTDSWITEEGTDARLWGTDTAPARNATMVPPLALAWQLGQELARALAVAGVRGTITRASDWTAATNLRTAYALGLRVPEELQGYADQLRDRMAADWRIEAHLGAGVLAAVFTAILSLAVPGAGAYIGAALAGVLQVLAEVVPQATVHFRDVWGRDAPTYERIAISGFLSPPTTPVQVIPPAPIAAPGLAPFVLTGTGWTPAPPPAAGPGPAFWLGAIAGIAKIVGLW